LIFLLATTAGLVVMNIYYNQPVLNAIAILLNINSADVAWVSTATQLGYATGLLFLLPIGDSVDLERSQSISEIQRQSRKPITMPTVNVAR
jgi:MFS family permease